MRITVAGANSFIGKRIIEIAEERKDIDVVAVIRGRFKTNFSKFNCVKQVVECEMEHYNRLGELVGDGDCFVDLSWKGSRGEDRQDSELQKYDYVCSMAAMRSMADAGYKMLVSSGSQAEYGQCNNFITEDTPLNPNTEYGKYKVQVFYETAELAHRYGIRFIEPRYFSLYGPGDYSKTLIMSCIKKMVRNEECILNECMQLWDYLYVDDAVEALLSLCKSENISGAYNFATGEYHEMRKFIMDIHSAVESNSRVWFGKFENTYNGPIVNLKPIVEKLKKDAGWEPKTSFIEGIRKTALTFT